MDAGLKNGVAWQSKPMKQSVIYDDQVAVEKALRKLEALPPLVTATEVREPAMRWVKGDLLIDS